MSKDIVWFCVFISIFMFGLSIMRIGLFQLSSDKLKEQLVKIAGNPLKGLLVGTIVTALLQSSSAVMVITVGFVTAGLLTFRQSIGIMLGANIGTTVTAELMTIDIGDAAVPIVLLGFILLLIPRKIFFSLGTTFLGLGSIFVAMKGFASLSASLYTYSFVETILLFTNNSTLVGIGMGTVLTALIHSSSAVIGIAMGFLHNHLLTIEGGIAIMLGSNIGTCVTALFASFGANIDAKRTAYAHIWLNVFGVLLFIPFISQLSMTVEYLTTSLDLQLAHASVIFNVICSILALPFINALSNFVIRVHKV
ncbi:Na/Pi cotransporter family protein [Bacillus sp. BGMRC 2118]|nr:Na/Pi cotransporter family protein [Bacillus sp. BGMRC 2118]